MRIFVYEFVTGGGWYEVGGEQPAPESLLAEGSAMLRALVRDFGRMPGVSIDTLRDRRQPDLRLSPARAYEVGSRDEEHDAIRHLARDADWSIVIAPEFSGYLLNRCQAVAEAGGKLLGPSARLMALASDKHATAEHLTAHGVTTARGVALAAGELLPEWFVYPAVLKPRDGAGSQGIQYIKGPAAGQKVDHQPGQHPSWRLEQFCHGMAVSVACLCGPGRIVPLVPCQQHLSEDGRFSYRGGRLPIDSSRAERAAQLAERAVRALAQLAPTGISAQRETAGDEELWGYLGVDLVLDEQGSRDHDVVIEINPRMTTSYVGLSAFARGNLAQAMLTIAAGGDFEMDWHPGAIEFDALGNVFSNSAG